MGKFKRNKTYTLTWDEGEFEGLVELHVEEKKCSKAVAFGAVIHANPAAYEDYLVRKGVRKSA